MSRKEYIVGVDTLVSVEATSEEEALKLAKSKFIQQWRDYVELSIEEVNDIE